MGKVKGAVTDFQEVLRDNEVAVVSKSSFSSCTRSQVFAMLACYTLVVVMLTIVAVR